jgi:hypothetical protein
VKMKEALTVCSLASLPKLPTMPAIATFEF